MRVEDRTGVTRLLPLLDGSRRAFHMDLGDTQTAVQLCLSPHCTTLASLLESTPDGWWEGPEHGWRRVVADRARRFDFEPLAPYTRHDRLPGFLTSSLRTPAPSFGEQLDEIRSVPANQVRVQLRETFPEGIPDTYTGFVANPSEALQNLCRALEAYFDTVVAPLWPTIRSFLEREIIRLGYAIVTRPPRDALGDVHPALRVVDDALVVDTGFGSEEGQLTGRRLKLTPLLSARPGLLADLKGRDEIKIGYAAPGSEEVWDQASRRPDGTKLGDLLGASRAVILESLVERATTTSLAGALHLAPATVSTHLAVLAQLGLVERSRFGRSVYYRQSDRGERLVGLFADGSSG